MLLAPHDNDSSCSLAQALAYRSAALFKLQRYDDTIADIDDAFSTELTVQARVPLICRKVQALQVLGRVCEAGAAAKTAATCLRQLPNDWKQLYPVPLPG